MNEVASQQDQEACAAIEAAMLGSIVGDALGVPVEFTSRSSLRESPVTGMRGFGTHNQPAGTWSDDSSLMLCLAESLAEKGVDYYDQAERFVSWMRDASWTPHGEVFDIGNATREAIFRLDAGVEPTEAGLAGEFHCGNGSLMRILPVGLYLAFAGRDERAEIAAACSRLTHGHPRCQLACVMFTEIVASLVRGKSFEEALIDGRNILKENLRSKFSEESAAFARLLSPGLRDLDEADVSSSGYVIHCLEASLWCAQRAGSFRAGLIAAVNLGDDTDTTGAVAGALLGLRFGKEQIPNDWIDSLARVSAVRGLIERFQDACLQTWRVTRKQTEHEESLARPKHDGELERRGSQQRQHVEYQREDQMSRGRTDSSREQGAPDASPANAGAAGRPDAAPGGPAPAPGPPDPR